MEFKSSTRLLAGGLSQESPGRRSGEPYEMRISGSAGPPRLTFKHAPGTDSLTLGPITKTVDAHSALRTPHSALRTPHSRGLPGTVKVLRGRRTTRPGQRKLQD